MNALSGTEISTLGSTKIAELINKVNLDFSLVPDAKVVDILSEIPLDTFKQIDQAVLEKIVESISTQTFNSLSLSIQQAINGAVDSTAPVYQSAATNGTGTKIILTYDSALYATTAGTSDFVVNVNGTPVTVSGVAISGSTVELTLATAVSNGQTVTVGYTAPTTAPTEAPVISTVDGTTVQTGTTTQIHTTTDATGNTVTTTVQVEQVIVTPVSDTRVEDTATPSAQTADIPLFWGEGSRTEWATTASLPVNIGITTEGARAPVGERDPLADLVQLIDETAPTSDATKTDMLSGGSDFMQALAQQHKDTLVINKVTLTVAEGITTAHLTPIVISGTANSIQASSGNKAPIEALVIDTRQLPAGSILELKNIEFAVIVGTMSPFVVEKARTSSLRERADKTFA
jgi:uncharacterized repeat protein (TIGR02059 family)